MTKSNLLLVDGDLRSLRVLEVSLRKSGFHVTTAKDAGEAFALIDSAQPDLIISDTNLPGLDGFEFCKQIKSKEEWEEVPFIFLTKESSIEHKIKGLELGVEDYLTKPIYIKEVLTRVRLLLEKHARKRMSDRRDRGTTFSGRLSDVGVVDVVQTVELSRKSGSIDLRDVVGTRGAIYFREGKVIDAEVGRLTGEHAVYRLLTWSDGEFEVRFRSLRRKDQISMSSQVLLMEGLRRLDEWTRIADELPPLTSILRVNVKELANRLQDLPDESNNVLRLFDGHRNLLEIVDEAETSDLEALQIISKLYFEVLLDAPQPSPTKSEPPISDGVVQMAMDENSVETSRAPRGTYPPKFVEDPLIGVTSPWQEQTEVEEITETTREAISATESIDSFAETFDDQTVQSPIPSMLLTEKAQPRPKSQTVQRYGSGTDFGKRTEAQQKVHTDFVDEDTVQKVDPIEHAIGAADVIAPRMITPPPVDMADAGGKVAYDEYAADADTIYSNEFPHTQVEESSAEYSQEYDYYDETELRGTSLHRTFLGRFFGTGFGLGIVVAIGLLIASAIFFLTRMKSSQDLLVSHSKTDNGQKEYSQQVNTAESTRHSQSDIKPETKIVGKHRKAIVASASSHVGKNGSVFPSNDTIKNQQSSTNIRQQKVKEDTTGDNQSVATKPQSKNIVVVRKVRKDSAETKTGTKTTKERDNVEVSGKEQYLRAKRYLRTGRHLDALTAIQGALATYSTASVFVTKVSILTQLRRPTEALQSAEMGLKRHPTSANLVAKKASILWKMGRQQQARESYQKFLKMEPNSSRADQVRARLNGP